MGVTGLWRLIEPAGKPVPVETLENKVLAVDISIWLHQMVKGYQDAKGAPLPNSHLIGLFQRLCKLLYFRVKPIFVFDGGFPELKKQTIFKRQDNKAKYNSESERLKRELAILLTKKTAINSLLGKQISPKKGNVPSNSNSNDDMFKLPALPEELEDSDSESEDEGNSSGSIIDLHSIDVNSESFKKLPVKEKYDLLIELKETRKMNSWGKLHELPKNSDNFSDFQMQRLLKRRKVQECLEDTEKEMGDGGMSLNELESLLNEEGIDTTIDNLPTRRIASNNTTRFLLINNVKQALANAKHKTKNSNENNIKEETARFSGDKETKKAVKMSLDSVNYPETSSSVLHSNADNKTTGNQFHGENKMEMIVKMSLDNVDDQDTSLSVSNYNAGNKTTDSELDDDLQKAIKMSMECISDSEINITTSDKADSYTSATSDIEFSDSEEEEYETPNMACAKAYIMQYTDLTHNTINSIIANKNSNECTKIQVTGDQILEEIHSEKSVIIDNVYISSNEDDNTDQIAEISNQSDLTANDKHKLSSPITLNSSAIAISTTNSVESTVNFSNSNENVIKSASISEESISCDRPLIECESSDDDFEEVNDSEHRHDKPFVQVTLNVDSISQDDIFADIFTGMKEIITNNSVNVEPNISSPMTKDVTREIEKNVAKPNKSDNSILHNEEIIQIKTNNTIKTANLSSENVNHNVSLNKEIKNKPEDNSKTLKTPITENVSAQLNLMVEEIQNEEHNLVQEKSRLDRIGRNITEQMTKEAQELLQIFGIPYIVAPMEAEAQCAFLENIKLTDGTITDDSDIWLFGGRTVYKNFFNQKKNVLQFLADRIEKSFNLTREQLILLALLVGSDYTTGVTGIGPVTALEILASFPINKKQCLNDTTDQARYMQTLTGLKEFKRWVQSGKRTDSTSLKKKLKNVQLTDDFPSIRVLQAYLEPNVEKSNEKFTWGELDITVLRDYTKAKFGWSQNKLDEIIKPVLKRMLDRKSQKSVQDYFKRKVEFQSLDDQMSKRVKAAIHRMVHEPSEVKNEEGGNIARADNKTATKRKLNENKIDRTKKPATSTSKRNKKTEESVLANHSVRVVSELDSGRTNIQINIPKSDRTQEIIPQREKSKQNLLQNKLKAIEVFRKTTLDRKKKTKKRKPNLPKEEADLSESSESD